MATLRKTECSPPRGEVGFSLLEVLVALAIAAILIAALGGVVGQGLRTWTAVHERTDRTRQARFAMDRMVTAVRGTTRLLLPLGEDPTTAYSESVRELLAVALDPLLDRNRDGFADADNDKDGRVDEDLDDDMTNDSAGGVVGIDDDNDGAVDESSDHDDDEDGNTEEDPLNGLDDDGDGSVDEDLDRDMNQDVEPGIQGVDDDRDGQIDEGSKEDDDEDDLLNEDWIDPVVYFLNGTTLMERLPDVEPVDGADYTERPIAEGVSQFRVERLPPGLDDRAVLLDITLELSGPDGTTFSLTSRVGVGAAR